MKIGYIQVELVCSELVIRWCVSVWCTDTNKRHERQIAVKKTLMLALNFPKGSKKEH